MSKLVPFTAQVTALNGVAKALSATTRLINSALITPIPTNAGNPILIGDSVAQRTNIPVSLPPNLRSRAGAQIPLNLADVFILSSADGDGVNIFGYEVKTTP